MYLALIYQLPKWPPKESRGMTWAMRRWGKGDCFGELSLICSAPRTATVRATTYGTLWVLPRGQEVSWYAPPKRRAIGPKTVAPRYEVMKMVLEFYFKMFPVYCKCMYLLGSTCEFSDIYMEKDGLRDAARKDSEGAPCWSILEAVSRWTDVSHCYLKWLTCHVEKKKLFQPYTLHTVDKLLKYNRGITHSWKVCVGICPKNIRFGMFCLALQHRNPIL